MFSCEFCEISKSLFYRTPPEENRLSLEIECNLKTVNYLDITLDLITGTHKPYRKPNGETLYIHAGSNQPANILKQLYLYQSKLQKQSSRGVPIKTCSKNMQQIYRRTHMAKCDFNKVALQLY